MNATVTVRLAKSSDLDQLADLFDQYRQFYECPPDLGAAKSWIADYATCRIIRWVVS